MAESRSKAELVDGPKAGGGCSGGGEKSGYELNRDEEEYRSETVVQ